jgi:aminopeptidase N
MENKETQKKFPLQRSEAEFRKSELSDDKGNYKVTYDLILVLRKMADKSETHPNTNLEGRLCLNFLYHGKTEQDLFLNFYGEVDSVKINGEKAATNYKERRVYLDHTKLKKGENNEVVILFSAKYDKGGVGLHHFTDPIDQREYLYTQFEPYECHLVFPVFDQPDIKATLAITLVGPDDWELLSNEHEQWVKNLHEDCSKTPEIKELFNSKGVHEDELCYLLKAVKGKNYKVAPFSTTAKISSYLYAICAGPYHCITDKTGYKVPLRIFMRQSLKTSGDPDEFFRVTIAGMEWYKNFFGLAYPFNKYDQIFSPEYNFGAMENVGLVTYNEVYCWKETPTQMLKSRFCITVLHELAHMWFGNLVTMKWWDDLWLNESFATFISFLCQEQAVGKEYPTAWAHFNNSKGIAYREDQKTTTHPVIGDITDTDKAQTHFDGIVYYKGSSLLKQMFYFIGEENFSNGLKEYFKIYAWNNTIFDDFVDQMVKALGNGDTFDLKGLCKKWIGEEGLNDVEAEWDSEGDKVKEFRIKQTPCLSEFPNRQTHMIDVLLIYDHDKSEIIKNVIIKNQEVTVIDKIKGLESPKAVVLNYNDWAYIKWSVDQTSLVYLGKEMYHVKSCDLLTRQLYYRSLFDMARDARISLAQYLDIVNDLLKQEADDMLITVTLRQIGSLITYYIPVRYYKEYASKMFDLVCFLLEKNVADKQVTMNLMEILISFATTEDHTNLLRTWLTDEPTVCVNGKKTVLPKELLNQNNRFAIVALIHRSSTISPEEKQKYLDNEIEKDKNSDLSTRAKCKCKASLPDKQVKQEIWNKLVNEPSSDSLYNMKSYMAGFASVEQLELIEDYLKNKFFEDAKTVGKQEHFYVDAWVNACAPIFYVDDGTIGRIECLAKESENDTLKRRLLELADDMKRFAKSQKLIETYFNEKK